MKVPVDHFLRAIDNERAAILTSNGSDEGGTGLSEGLLLGSSDAGFDYVYTPRKPLPEGGRVLIRRSRTREPWTKAVAAVQPDGKVRLTTATDLGSTPPDLQTTPDETATLDSLAERISAMDKPPAAGWILGEGTPRIGRFAQPERVIPGYRSLTLTTRQRLAIEHALGSEVTFLWGPPGTGKTEVLARIVEGFVHQGKRVLFLAPTHFAVDQAIARVCTLLERHNDFGAGLVQRAGDIAIPALEAQFGDRIVTDRIVARQAAGLIQRTADLTGHLKKIEAGISSHNEVAAAAAHLKELRAQRTAVIDDSVLFARWREDIRAAELRLSACNDRLTGVEPVDRLRDLERRITADLTKIDEERRKVADTVRGRCRVLGATVAKAVQSRSLLSTVDVVIIDEAGMVALPLAWAATGLSQGQVVVAGDFRQLPAITRGSSNRKASAAERDHSALWMDRDPFSAAGLVNAKGEATPDARMICLDEQFRMRPAICSVVNEIAYPDARLRTGRDDVSALPPSPLLPGPLVLIDTSSRRVPYAGGPRDGHKSNPVHEAIIHEYIRGLQHDEVLPARKWTDRRPTDRMAVIVPYRRQVTSLKTSLKYRFGADYEGLVDTVHRFQGSQRPLVLIDTVAGAGRDTGPFYTGIGLSSTTCRLLNVAVSRAQDHLVVVADLDFFDQHLAPHGEAARLLRYLRHNAQQVSVDELIPVRAAYDLAGLSDEDRARPAFFPADEVARAVEWDIGNARHSIDVFCPFLDPRPVTQWLRHLAPKSSEGVQVTVHTRPYEEEPAKAALANKILAARCEVATRERMHEKVVIIDDAVLWHGSLNLLANTGPTDLMMRVTDPGACQRVRQIVGTAKMDRPARPWPGPSSPARDTAAIGTVIDGRLYLDVPREQKEEAKQVARARWDRERQLWHVDAATPRDKVRRWLP